MTHLIIVLTLIALDIVIFTLLMAHILLRRNGSSETRLAWIVFIILVPYIGALLYLLVGGAHFSIRRKHCDILEMPGIERPDLADLPGMDINTPEPYRRVFTLAENLCPSDALGGHALELKTNSDSFLEPLCRDIEQATRHVHLLTYIYLTDQAGQRVADALRAAAKRGVKCRVLVDSLGSKAFLKSQLREDMMAEGVRVVEALPARLLRIARTRLDLRNHRKIVVIDNSIGYLGSQNIADPSFAPKAKYAPWVDCMVRMKGPAVHDLQELFLSDWYMDTVELEQELIEEVPHVEPDGAEVQVIGSGPDLPSEILSMVIQTCFHVASEEIILTTPYFVPDIAMETAMLAAARRGVDTTLILPKNNDSKLVALASRSHYERLLEAGIKIHHYTSGLLHAKTLTVDRQLFLVGSANLDRRSLELNFEVNLLGWKPDFAGQLRLLQKSYLNESERVSDTQWLQARWPKRLARNAAGMLSPLL
ncbi:MAG: cardiolipin synthase [Phycisphaerae bacterium]|nr:cardiolipin synthase [Phycisphaerae bacterium]